MFLKPEDYPLETFYVETKDGYILSLFRLHDITPDPKKIDEYGDTPRSRPPVLIVHGLGSSGNEWLCNVPEKTLPYMLTRDGYDCWIACHRGSRLTGPTPHVKYTQKQKEYWDFCVDDFANYDVPAMIDFILQKTGHDSLFHVGHSLGGTTLLGLLASKPEYNSKIRLAASMTPATDGKHCHIWWLKWWSAPAMDPWGKIKFVYRRPFSQKTCNEQLNSYLPCLPGKKKLGGWIWNFINRRLIRVVGKDQVEKDRAVLLAQLMPGQTSVKVMCHLLQAMDKQRFQSYDYGRQGNLKRYGQAECPTYDLTKITAPFALFTSEKDHLVPAEGVISLSKELKNVVFFKNIPKTKKFYHADFMMGKDAHHLVYEDILKLFRASRKNENEIQSDSNHSVVERL